MNTLPTEQEIQNSLFLDNKLLPQVKIRASTPGTSIPRQRVCYSSTAYSDSMSSAAKP